VKQDINTIKEHVRHYSRLETNYICSTFFALPMWIHILVSVILNSNKNFLYCLHIRNNINPHSSIRILGSTQTDLIFLYAWLQSAALGYQWALRWIRNLQCNQRKIIQITTIVVFWTGGKFWAQKQMHINYTATYLAAFPKPLYGLCRRYWNTSAEEPYGEDNYYTAPCHTSWETLLYNGIQCDTS